MTLTIGAAILLGYLLGSIPFGLLLTRATGGGDIRQTGSGNIGATNVLRSGNKKLAALTLLLDALKGVAAVLIAAHLFKTTEHAGLAAGMAAFAGHIWPVWLHFKGGKGIATGLGVIGVLSWPVGLSALGAWLLIALETGYSSAAALGAFALAPVMALILQQPEALIASAVFLPVVLWTHRANIKRLRSSTETKIRLRPVKKP